MFTIKNEFTQYGSRYFYALSLTSRMAFLTTAGFKAAASLVMFVLAGSNYLVWGCKLNILNYPPRKKGLRSGDLSQFIFLNFASEKFQNFKLE